MRVKHALVATFLCLAAVSILRSQTALDDEIKIASQPYVPEDPNAIRVKTNLVEISVVVRDAHGQPLSGLTKEEFEIFDQGKQQAISLFTAELAHPPATPPPSQPDTATSTPVSVPPRYLGLYFDDQTTSVSDLVYARKAAEAFIQNSMEETDRVGIFTSSTTVTQEFTSNKKQLLDTLAKLLSHQRVGMNSCPHLSPNQAYMIEKFHSDPVASAEAVQCDCDGVPKNQLARCASIAVKSVRSRASMVLSLAEETAQESLGVLGDVVHYMEKMPGRRTLIMASSGFFSQSDKIQQDMDKMIDAAIHAGIVINTLDAKGLYTSNDPSDGPPVTISPDVAAVVGSNSGALNAKADSTRLDEKDLAGDSMSAIAYGTGGKFFHNNNDLNAGLREMAEIPAASYVLGFSPGDAKDNGAYHNLKVKVPGRNGVAINARPGYFAHTQEQAAPSNKLEKLDREVMASDTLTEIAADVTTQTVPLGIGQSSLKINVHVPGQSLSFKMEEKRHAERLIFITALFDTQNQYLAGTEAVMEMKLREPTFKIITHDGADAKTTLQVPAGTYRLREVVQEVVGGRMATSTREVEIR